ncbi:MAG TPA: dipeptidase [Desulfatiglandales bacterium]|nr:dipeptidase [Desulfatiglandales bacterium]
MSKKSFCDSRRDFIKKTTLGSIALFGSQKIFSENRKSVSEGASSVIKSGISPESASSKSGIFSGSRREPAIHFSSIVINHACPLVYPAMDENYIKKLQEGGITFSMSTIASNDQFRSAVNQIVAFYEKFENNDKLLFITQVDDIYRAKKEGKVGVGFHFQNSRPVEYDTRLLDVFYRLGVRVIQLTYNEKNMVGDGCTELTDCDLSKFGKKMIKRMNEIGMLVDLSHVGYRSSMEAMEESKDPVIFSHSNAWKVCPSKRNLKDDQIKALAKKKGVIGMNVYPGFVKKNKPSLNDLLDHVDYIANLVGTDYIGIGFDFSEPGDLEEYKYWGYDPDTYLLPPWDHPKDIEEISKAPDFTRGLISRGYSEKDIKKILGENFIRVFKQVWK